MLHELSEYHHQAVFTSKVSKVYVLFHAEEFDDVVNILLF